MQSTPETMAPQRLRRSPPSSQEALPFSLSAAIRDGAAATAREAQLDAKKLCPSPCPLQSGGGYPSWPAPQSPVHEKRWISAEQPQPTAAHRTITTAHRPDHIRLSAQVRSHSTQFTQAPSLAARQWPPETRSFFCHFGGVFLM